MNQPNKKPGKLNLNKNSGGSQSQKPLSPEEMITHFYNTMANCCIEIAVSLNKSAEIQQEILIELSDMKDNMNRICKKEGYISDMEIEERENEQEPPDGKPV